MIVVMFYILHPAISVVVLRFIGVGAIVVLLVSLGWVEAVNGKLRRRRLLQLSPVLVVATIVVVYTVLITQGSIK